MRSFEETLQYLYNSLPMYQRVGKAALKFDLTNTLLLCDRLGNPQTKFRSVHVAGTNGKGSVSHMLASILDASGYLTGLYTSPHLKSFTERIRVNGRQIPESSVVEFVNRIKPEIESIKPSFFELTVAMAFDHFAKEEVDIAVIETGLGGRLDSTNVILPVLSIITNVGLDHKDLLGETLDRIATEKAGIIKAGIPVVISEHQDSTDRVFQKIAEERSAALWFAGDRYEASMPSDGTLVVLKDSRKHLTLNHFPLQGWYQCRNLPAVLMALDVLGNGRIEIDKEAVERGLSEVTVRTGLKGRWQKLSDKPLIICDTGHNTEGISEVLRQVRTQNYNRLYIILGLVSDKDTDAVLALFPRDAFYIFCQAQIPRALAADRLLEVAAPFGLNGIAVPIVSDAIERARGMAGPDDMIFIGGSTFVVAEIPSL